MSTTLVISDQTLTAVAINQSKDLRDMQKRDYPITDAIRESNVPWDGGEVATVPWDVDNHSNPTRLVSGYEAYDQTVRATLKPGIRTPAFVCQPILVSLRDETIYDGPGKVINITEQRTNNVNRHMSADFQAHAFRGPASGSWVGKAAYADFDTLNGVDHSNGYLQANASGSNTLHSVSRAAYPAATHPGFHNVYRDSGNAANTNLLNDMYRVGIQLEMRGAKPVPSENTWYAGELPLTFLKQSLRSSERYIIEGKERQLDGGAGVAFTFGGIPIRPCIDMPTNGANTAATPVSVVLINWKNGIRARFYAKWNWIMLPFKEIPGTAVVRAALKLIGGNFEAMQPGLCALISKAEQA